MFTSLVAQFYRAKGYEVHENPRVQGLSENIYTVAMVADGPLGALLISFGDAGGIDAAEVARVRTMARDIGATPVIAAPNLTSEVRRLSAQMGVVVVDEATVTESGPLPKELGRIDPTADPLRRDLDAHPWPASGRAYSYAAPTAAQARDVEELLSDLAPPAPAVPPPTRPSLLAPAREQTRPDPPVAPAASGTSALAPPEMQMASPQPAAPAGTRFSWLGGAATTTGPASQQVDLSALLGSRMAAATAPAVEHESALDAKTPASQRAQILAGSAWDSVRDWPWKTIVATGAGAALLILAIRWLA